MKSSRNISGPITQRESAKMLGVSQAAVSKPLRRTGQITPKRDVAVMTKRPAWMIGVCLAVIAFGIWVVLSRGMSPETGDGTVRKGQAPDRHSTDAGAGVEKAAVPTQKVTLNPTPRPSILPEKPALPANVQPTSFAGKTQAAVAASTTGPSAMQQLDAAVARFADTSIPLEKRVAEVEQLGKVGDADAVRTLMKLGDAYAYLNFKAVEALGNVKTLEVAKYLEVKLGDKDPNVISHAIASLAKVQGAEAVPAIAATIAGNRQRPDGYQDTVCAAGVKALGAIGSATAVPALADEFENTVGKTLQHEYGSQVAAAIGAIGDASAIPALAAYAARLQKEHAAMADNVMGQRYLEGKIKDVKDALEALAQKREAK